MVDFFLVGGLGEVVGWMDGGSASMVGGGRAVDKFDSTTRLSCAQEKRYVSRASILGGLGAFTGVSYWYPARIYGR